MPLIPRVGRKSLRIRLLFLLMHTVLALGALTMLYPFLLMLGTSITSSTDTNEFRIIPRYLTEDNALFAKYVDDKYAGDLERINTLYHTDFKRLSEITLPSQIDVTLVKTWEAQLKEIGAEYVEAGFRGYGTHTGRLTIAYRAFLRKKFQNDIQALNKNYKEEHRNFETLFPPNERLTMRNWNYNTAPKTQDFLQWKATLPKDWLIVVTPEPLFARYLWEESPQYASNTNKLAQVWGVGKRRDLLFLPTIAPSNPEQRRDWESFVRRYLPFRFIQVAPSAQSIFQASLKKRYRTLNKLNATYQSNYTAFEAIPLPKTLPDSGALNVDWGEFIANRVPLFAIRIDDPTALYTRLLQSSTRGIAPRPYYEADAQFVKEHASELRRGYLTRNYALVIDYVLLHGRALWVTVLFCLAMILTTLTVNPLCAYALSRYNLPYAYNILLFLLATMAFPAEVAMIPNFLLLKELNLLNTYWALILPGAASGFSIFLLKGFFDSLPRELFEAGMIDGASETRMFWQITLPLARPIFAVIALEAFTAAYGAFMFALILCQNPEMWTIMVWLYQLQINNAQYVNMAALTIASLPTLLVFIFAQNVILRGIILPTEK